MHGALAGARGERAGPEDGVTLIEMVVALTILATVLVSLSGMMWQMGRQGRIAGDAAGRSVALETASALAQTVPWDSLTLIVGCSADSAAAFHYTRCIDVTAAPGGLRQVRAVIAPTNAITLAPDTLTVIRNRPRPPNPLDVP